VSRFPLQLLFDGMRLIGQCRKRSLFFLQTRATLTARRITAGTRSRFGQGVFLIQERCHASGCCTSKLILSGAQIISAPRVITLKSLG
jgi:hypothetical protein